MPAQKKIIKNTGDKDIMKKVHRTKNKATKEQEGKVSAFADIKFNN